MLKATTQSNGSWRCLGEAAQVLKLLWTEHDPVSLDGRHYQLRDARLDPKPLQRPHPPLWIGSRGERLGLRKVAEHADVWVAATLPGEDASEVQRLSSIPDSHCEAISRDPGTVRRAIQIPLASDDDTLRSVEQHLRVGLTDIVLMLYERGEAAVPAAERAINLLPRLRSLD